VRIDGQRNKGVDWREGVKAARARGGQDGVAQGDAAEGGRQGGWSGLPITFAAESPRETTVAEAEVVL
jgi:hypothetical protein